MQQWLLWYLFTLQLASFLACGWDKWQARRAGWRVPERTLLFLCVLGGSPGFLLGMVLFRHKTRKPKFLWGVPLVFAAQVSLLWAAVRLFC